MRRRAVSTHEELEQKTEESPGTGIPANPPPPLTFSFTCAFFCFSIFSALSRSNQQASCLHTLLGMAQSLILQGLGSLVTLPPQRGSSSQEKNIQPRLVCGQVPVFCLMRGDWNYLVSPWNGLNSEAIFGGRGLKKRTEEKRIVLWSGHCISVFEKSQTNSSGQVHITGALKKTGHIKRDIFCIYTLFNKWVIKNIYFM